MNLSSPHSLVALAISLCQILACSALEPQDIPPAQLLSMIPPPPPVEGQPNCKLTLEFNDVPPQIDPKDVRVRFYSVAMRQPAEFDWSFIAANHTLPRSSLPVPRRGDRAASPPLGHAMRVEFPLAMRNDLAGVTGPVWLQAELYWGGEIQDSARMALGPIFAGALSERPGAHSTLGEADTRSPESRLMGLLSEEQP